jgi:NodT family efflux transporter outer membrane factor (OMF) lipoprotein
MKHVFAALLAATALAACVPSDVTPQLKTVDSNSLGLSQTPAPPPAAGWWKAFGDPQLDKIADEALAGNPSLEAALARMRGAEADIQGARSQLLPQLSLQGEDQYQRFSKTYIIPPPYGGTYQWLGQIEGNLSWNIDFWGKQAQTLRKSKALARASEYDVAAARQALAGALAYAYVSLDSAYKLSDVAADYVKERADVAALTTRRVKSGLDSQVEQKEADALLAQARQQKIAADASKDIAVHAIAALIGRGADAYGEIGRPNLKLTVALELPNELPADLLARRPDVLAARARVQAMIAGRKVAAAAYYPDVNLLAFAGWASIGLTPLFKSQSLAYGAGPAINLPIFDGGQLDSQYGAATANLDEAIADYNGAVTNGIRQTADAITQIRSLDQQELQQHDYLTDSGQGYHLADSRYRSGLANELTVFDAETQFIQARQQQVSLDAQSVTQRITLLLSIGGDYDPKHPVAASLADADATKDHTP